MESITLASTTSSSSSSLLLPAAATVTSCTSSSSSGATVYLPTNSIPLQQSHHHHRPQQHQVSFGADECLLRRVAIVEVNHKPFTSAVTGSTSSSSEKQSHVLTIQISQDEEEEKTATLLTSAAASLPLFKSNNIVQIKEKVTVVSLKSCEKPSLIIHSNQNHRYNNNNIQIVQQQQHQQQSVQDENEEVEDMVQKSNNDLEVNKPSTYLYYMMPSGQCSPSDTMDSGTCSDLENTTPPPLPKKMSPKTKSSSHTPSNKNGKTGMKKYNHLQQQNSPTTNSGHSRCQSFTDSEESESSLSCDSLTLTDLNGMLSAPSIPPPPPPSLAINIFQTTTPAKTGNGTSSVVGLPDSLLRDIRSVKLFAGNNSDFQKNSELPTNASSAIKKNGFAKVKIKSVGQPLADTTAAEANASVVTLSIVAGHFVNDVDCVENTKNYEDDKFYHFHLNERVLEVNDDDGTESMCRDDESFAGYRDIHSGTSTIRSSKGTVRGVKNRVRNGIATFLQLQQHNVKVSEIVYVFEKSVNFFLFG